MFENELNDFFEIVDVCDTQELTENSPQASYEAADEVLAACVNELGCVDLRWMSQMSGIPAQELASQLKGTAIFQDPEGYDIHQAADEDWLLSPQYLSGNISEKLEIAEYMNRKYQGLFEQNISALKGILPARVKFSDIGISIGSPWIPANYYSAFAREGLGLLSKPEVAYSPECHQWKVTVPKHVRNDINNIYTYGTMCMPAVAILENTLNANMVKVYNYVPNPDRKSGSCRVLNKNETLAAQEKQADMQRAFQEWVKKDPKKMKYLEDIFYNTYACNVSGQYNGDFLKLPDLNPDFVPYPHQKNAVARIILEKDVLLNHVVGSGKTNIQIIGIHERKRMGLSDKNLVIVPNNVLEAFESAHQHLYPNDRILVVHPEDFKPDCRRAVLEKIRDEDYVAVYMAFSSFEMIRMSRSYKLEKQKERIRSLRASAASATKSWEKNKLESAAERRSKELEKMRENLPADIYPAFDELGITTLAVDEAHNFKNISLESHADGIVGMHVNGSKKCNEMLEKARFVREQGGGIIFSTGTPLTNSISDLFVLQTFLQPEQMELLNIGHFDEWVSNFAQRQSGFEIDVDSQNYRIMTRFSRFHNLPELTSLFANVCDFYNGKDSGVGLPKCEGYIDTVVQKSAQQSKYIEELVERTERIRAKCVRETEDNLLKVTHDGRAAALDIRLADPKSDADPFETKTYFCAKNVFECWEKYPGTAQLVFCDLGTPKQGFNLYEELKIHLELMGIPEHEVAFVHDAKTDAQRRKLFAAVNKAQIRVLIGSTAKLGTGVNVQENLIAVHHLDVPWKPSDMIQREGRLIRQGNKNGRVYRYRYITAGTFDAYSWQIIENKQRFIGQFMSNTLADRDARDLDDTVLGYAEIKALSVGDPLLKVRIDTSNELERAKIQCRLREQELRRLRNIVREDQPAMDRIRSRKRNLEQDLKHFVECREKLEKSERDAFGEELLDALKDNYRKDKERCFDTLHGFRILLPAMMTAEKPLAVIEGVSGNRYEIDMRGAKPVGCIQRIEYFLLHLMDRIQAVEDEGAKQKARITQANGELQKGNRFAKQVSKLTELLMDIDEELNRRAQEGAA